MAAREKFRDPVKVCFFETSLSSLLAGPSGSSNPSIIGCLGDLETQLGIVFLKQALVVLAGPFGSSNSSLIARSGTINYLRRWLFNFRENLEAECGLVHPDLDLDINQARSDSVNWQLTETDNFRRFVNFLGLKKFSML